jgi:hypothetical protein
MEFQSWLIAKQNLEELLSLKTGLYSYVWTLKKILSKLNFFLQIYILVEQVVRNTSHFVSVV